jgi:hypothetical protein
MVENIHKGARIRALSTLNSLVNQPSQRRACDIDTHS